VRPLATFQGCTMPHPYRVERSPTSYGVELSVGGREHGFTPCSPPVVVKAQAYLGTSCTAARACRGSQLPSSMLKAALSNAPIGHGSAHLALYLSMITRTWQGVG
jgi:hypothetical protein